MLSAVKRENRAAMSSNASAYETFEAVKARLDEIVAAVSDDSLPLDDALDLYEEAVALGMRASELLESGIEIEESADGHEPDEAAEADGTSEGVAPENSAVQASAAN